MLTTPWRGVVEFSAMNVFLIDVGRSSFQLIGLTRMGSPSTYYLQGLSLTELSQPGVSVRVSAGDFPVEHPGNYPCILLHAGLK